ncbi:MAG: pseudaminic acid cytidylyltransferase [Flagellimonas sp.]
MKKYLSFVMSNLCIIPARGGSKRIPRKNIKPFFGKPIIAYSIEAALMSNLFDEVMVSTDDKEIASIAVKYGAKVPFLRSKENSDDFATTFDVIKESLDNYNRQGRFFEHVCCLYPCAPFVTSDSLKNAHLKLNEESQAVIPIVRFSFPVQRAFKIKGTYLKYSYPEFEKSRSQDLEVTYHDAGQYYFFKPQAVLNQKTLMPTNTTFIELDEFHVQDIDTEMDWKLAELKYQLSQNEIS